jgi:hypothetical protein
MLTWQTCTCNLHKCAERIIILQLISGLTNSNHMNSMQTNELKYQAYWGNKAPTDSQHCFKAKHAFHCAFACFEWLSAPLYFALRHVVFRFVFLASVSATRNKTRKHEKQRVVSKRVFCLPSDIHFSLLCIVLWSTKALRPPALRPPALRPPAGEQNKR